MKRMLLATALLLSALCPLGYAQQDKKQPTPTVANLAYGKHERQVLDFWKAKSDKPTPSSSTSTAAAGGEATRTASAAPRSSSTSTRASPWRPSTTATSSRRP